MDSLVKVLSGSLAEFWSALKIADQPLLTGIEELVEFVAWLSITTTSSLSISRTAASGAFTEINEDRHDPGGHQ
jgi:hypothetical protein